MQTLKKLPMMRPSRNKKRQIAGWEIVIDKQNPFAMINSPKDDVKITIACNGEMENWK